MRSRAARTASSRPVSAFPLGVMPTAACGRRRGRPRLWALLAFGCAILACAARGAGAKDCDNRELRNLIQNVCTGVRIRRSSAAAAGGPADLGPDSATVARQSHVRKRQIMSIREIILSSGAPMYNAQYRPIPRLHRSESAAMAPPAVLNFYQRPGWSEETMPQTSTSDSNFDEIMKLFGELYKTVFHPSRRSREIADQYKGVKVECCRANTDRCVEKIKGLCVNFN